MNRSSGLRRGIGVPFLVVVSFLGLLAGPALAGNHKGHWMATWATANKVATPVFDASITPPVLVDTTLRQIVRISVGGERFRVWFSNEFGTAPLTIDGASIAASLGGDLVDLQTLRQLSFGGSGSVTIPAGERVRSDPVDLALGHRSDLAVSLHITSADPASPVTLHARALQTSHYVTGQGDRTMEATLGGSAVVPTPITQWYFLAAVDAFAADAPRPYPVVALLGDSITDGDQLPAPDEPVDRNERYSDYLAEALIAPGRSGGKGKRHGTLAAVINLGISGNQVSDSVIGESAVMRLDRDVLSQTGVSHVVLLEGINDIGLPAFLTFLDGAFGGLLQLLFGRDFPEISAEQIIVAQQQIAKAARRKGLIVVGATLPPSGTSSLFSYCCGAVEDKRRTVNKWIRTSGTFDIVIDFDKVLRDPHDPVDMRADLTSDGLHPNAAGYAAMAREAARRLKRSL